MCWTLQVVRWVAEQKQIWSPLYQHIVTQQSRLKGFVWAQAQGLTQTTTHGPTTQRLDQRNATVGAGAGAAAGTGAEQSRSRSRSRWDVMWCDVTWHDVTWWWLSQCHMLTRLVLAPKRNFIMLHMHTSIALQSNHIPRIINDLQTHGDTNNCVIRQWQRFMGYIMYFSVHLATH